MRLIWAVNCFTDDDQTGSQLNTPTEAETPAPEIQMKRSARETHIPNYYGQEECNLLQTPTIFKEATSSSDKPNWKEAMK